MTLTNSPQGIPTTGFFGHRYITEFGYPTGENYIPSAVTSSNTRIYVSDSGNDTIHIFDHSYNFIKKFGINGSGNGEFDGMQDIAYSSGNLYVLDVGNYRVQIFDYDGNYQGQFGEYDSDLEYGTIGNFQTPTGLDVDDTYVYVSDFITSTIHKFDLSGTPIEIIYLEAVHIGDISFNGTVFAVAKGHIEQGIQFFNTNGDYIKGIGSTGSEIGQFASVAELKLYDEVLIVADGLSSRIQVFNLNDENATLAFGNYGTEVGEFNWISGMCANDTHLFITDWGNQNVKLFEIHFGDVWEQTVTETLTENSTVTTTETEFDTITTGFPSTEIEYVTSQVTETTTEVITDAKSELDYPFVLSFVILIPVLLRKKIIGNDKR
jgi:DNA-binding beta-propeller fold protein YncE